MKKKAEFPDYNASVAEMTDQLELLATQLNTLSFNFDNVSIAKPYRIYTEQDCIRLRYRISTLITEINKKYIDENSQVERDCKQVLHQTFVTLSTPNHNNLRALQTIADSVEGRGQAWKKVAWVLGTIIGLVAGLLPGIIMWCEAANRWDNYTQKGLSLQTETLRRAIRHTTGYQYVDRQTWGRTAHFFNHIVEDSASPGSPEPSAPPHKQ